MTAVEFFRSLLSLFSFRRTSRINQPQKFMASIKGEQNQFLFWCF